MPDTPKRPLHAMFHFGTDPHGNLLNIIVKADAFNDEYVRIRFASNWPPRMPHESEFPLRDGRWWVPRSTVQVVGGSDTA